MIRLFVVAALLLFSALMLAVVGAPVGPRNPLLSDLEERVIWHGNFFCSLVAATCAFAAGALL